MNSRAWYLYLLRCADDTVYTGITTDLKRRVNEHNAGRGARYTSNRRPVTLIGAWRLPDQGAALRAEARFKRLSRRRKLQAAARRLPFEGAPFLQERVKAEEATALRFCPRCGGLLGDDYPHPTCTVCGHIHYRNAKPCAGALIVRDGRLLLIRRAIEPFLNHWDIPGGFLEPDEHPECGVVREAREETGLEIQPTELFGFYVDRYGRNSGAYCLNIYFVAQVVDGQERLSDEVAEMAWFTPDELPEAIAFDHAQQVLEDWARWMKQQQEQPSSKNLSPNPKE